MTILVTGAGIVGTHLASALVKRGDMPILFDKSPQPHSIAKLVPLDRIKLVTGDILNFEELSHVIRRNKIKVIVHTAAAIRFEDSPYAGVSVNYGGTANVLEAARILDVNRIVFTSSHSIYQAWTRGWQKDEPFDEDAPIEPGNLYAATKAGSEFLGAAYAQKYGLEFVSLRYPFIFGPWVGSTGGTANELISKIITDVRAGTSKPAKRLFDADEFIYSIDVARSIIAAIDSKKPAHNAYNIGMGEICTFERLVRLVEDIIGMDIKITIEPPGTQRRAYKGFAYRTAPASIKRAELDLGYRPVFDLESALRDYSALMISSSPAPSSSE